MVISDSLCLARAFIADNDDSSNSYFSKKLTRFTGIVEGASFNVLGHEMASYSRYLLPASEHVQRHLLLNGVFVREQGVFHIHVEYVAANLHASELVNWWA